MYVRMTGRQEQAGRKEVTGKEGIKHSGKKRKEAQNLDG